ncbi:MAG: glycosyltransferase [Pyrinomonadaceae bacterium]
MALSETANQKVFSIIMATYNCGQKVENTLQSILSQNKELFELIVVDGASTDNTLEYLKKYESSLTLISEKDDGIL